MKKHLLILSISLLMSHSMYPMFSFLNWFSSQPQTISLPLHGPYKQQEAQQTILAEHASETSPIIDPITQKPVIATQTNISGYVCGLSKQVYDFAWSPKEKNTYAFSVANNAPRITIDNGNWEQTMHVPLNMAEEPCISFNQEGTLLASKEGDNWGGLAQSVKLYNLNSKQVSSIAIQNPMALVWHATKNRIAITKNTGGTDVLEVDEKTLETKQICNFKNSAGTTRWWDLAWNPQEETITTVIDGKDPLIALWNSETGEQKTTYQPYYYPNQLQWDPSGKVLAYTNVYQGKKQLTLLTALGTKLFQTVFGNEIGYRQDQGAWVNNKLPVCSGNNVYIFNAEAQKMEATLQHNSPVLQVASTTDGKWHVTGLADRLVVWNEKFQKHKEVKLGTTNLVKIAFNPDNSKLGVEGINQQDIYPVLGYYTLEELAK